MKYEQKTKRIAAVGLFLVFVMCMVFLSGNRDSTPGTGINIISLEDALAEYDYMWKVLEENYPFLRMAERKNSFSVDALKANYRNQIEELGPDQIDFCEYYEILQGCIGKFGGLGHLKLLSPVAYETYLRDLEAAKQSGAMMNMQKWSLELYNDPVVKKRYAFLAGKYDVRSNGGDGTASRSSAENLNFKNINEDTAYVRIRSFMTENIEKDREKLSAWFAENADKKNVIIDITGNGGGNDSYWMNLIIAPNIEDTLRYSSYFITPYGEDSREQFAVNGVRVENLSPDVDKLLELPQINKEDLSGAKYFGKTSYAVEPVHEKKSCSGRFFLLVDNRVSSASDGFARFCRETGFATVVGHRTGGDSGGGNVFIAKLPVSGLLMKYRARNSLNGDGSSNVEFGTTPDVEIPKERGYLNTKILEFCLDYIETMEE